MTLTRKILWSVTKKTRLRSIKLLVMDCDGTLTDGDVFHLRFDCQDGLGIALLPIEKAIITGNRSPLIMRRAEQLHIGHVMLGVYEKKAVFEALISELGLKHEEVCYVGDDSNDIECMQIAGIGIAVRNATKKAKKAADFVTRNRGGHGALREVADMLMRGQEYASKDDQRYVLRRRWLQTSREFAASERSYWPKVDQKGNSD